MYYPSLNTFFCSASMAHKCNHSFDPNAKFVLGFHPRWGQVPSVQTLKAVEANEEITVSYDYSLDKAPPWYQDLYAKRFLDSCMISGPRMISKVMYDFAGSDLFGNPLRVPKNE